MDDIQLSILKKKKYDFKATFKFQEQIMFGVFFLIKLPKLRKLDS